MKIPFGYFQGAEVYRIRDIKYLEHLFSHKDIDGPLRKEIGKHLKYLKNPSDHLPIIISNAGIGKGKTHYCPKCNERVLNKVCYSRKIK
jgi:hypothetical protein